MYAVDVALIVHVGDPRGCLRDDAVHLGAVFLILLVQDQPHVRRGEEVHHEVRLLLSP